MSDNIRRWVQVILGVALVGYALRFSEPAHRLEYVGLGCLLIDPEHLIKALGLWRGNAPNS